MASNDNVPTTPPAPAPAPAKAAPEAVTPQAPRNRLAGSHDRMFITEHHRKAPKK